MGPSSEIHLPTPMLQHYSFNVFVSCNCRIKIFYLRSNKINKDKEQSGELDLSGDM